ncbi:hypothetical protein MGN70_009249 [Eutypa lata]|nr:hypothetical protein MGN70_009249 [Eutypa lata]
MTANRTMTKVVTPMPTLVPTVNGWFVSSGDAVDEVRELEPVVGAGNNVDGAGADGTDVEEATSSFCHQDSTSPVSQLGYRPSQEIRMPNSIPKDKWTLVSRMLMSGRNSSDNNRMSSLGRDYDIYV